MAKRDPIENTETHDVTSAPSRDATAEAILLLAKTLIANGPKDPMDVLGLSPDRQRALTTATPSRRYRIINGLSHDTGARMGLVVAEELGKDGKPDKRFPHGRVVNFRGYKRPADTLTYEAQGGRLPDGFDFFVDGRAPCGQDPDSVSPAEMTIRGKEWLRKTFYTRDHLDMIGKALRSVHCDPESGQGLDTPWEIPLADAAE